MNMEETIDKSDDYDKVVIHFPKFQVEDNGEKDGPLYEYRFHLLVKMLSDFLRKQNRPHDQHYFFYHLPVTKRELERCLEDCDTCRKNPDQIYILSTVMEESRWSLKSQIHPLFGNSNAPPWYKPQLGVDLIPYTAEGYTSFDIDSLEDSLLSMTNKYKCVRIKNGCGTGGLDQCTTSAFNEVIPSNVLSNINICGVVVEKNLSTTKPSVSFTSFSIPTTDGDRMFRSVGIIVEDDQRLYRGTTCMVSACDETVVGFDCVDPIFGRLAISSENATAIVRFGTAVSDIYRKHLSNAHLPRLNIDIMYDEGTTHVLVDASLRIGGNSWNEFRGAERILYDDQQSSYLQSIRVLRNESKEFMDHYHHLGQIYKLYEGPQDNESITFIGIDHEEKPIQ
jgi:hypothetical protein